MPYPHVSVVGVGAFVRGLPGGEVLGVNPLGTRAMATRQVLYLQSRVVLAAWCRDMEEGFCHDICTTCIFL